MPIYEYRCQACGHQFEDFRPAAAADDAGTCPQCGKPKLQRLLSAFATSASSKGGADMGSACSSSSPFK